MRFLTAALFALALGCAGGDETEPTGVGSVCAAGEWLRDDGACIPAGLPPDMPCAPAEWLRDDGRCVPAGVPPDGCGAGFVHDGDRGCVPILPEAPCMSGSMAVPGETSCRQVASCATGTWGGIPSEVDTEHVDASYAGTDSDGSAQKPWPTVQGAVDAAAAGAIVAIAAGSYHEDVIVTDKAVRLWGVCPSLVEVVGTGAELAAVRVLTGATGSELRGMAVRGDALGIVSSGSLDVVLDRVWVHHNAGMGIDVESAFGPSDLTILASLVEHNREAGVIIGGAEASIEASVIRATQPNAGGGYGRGVDAETYPTGTSSAVHVRNSLIEQNWDAGVFAIGSQVTVEESVVVGTEFGAADRGINAQSFADTGAPSTLVLRASLVEHTNIAGVFVASSDATLENTVVRGTEPGADGAFGIGVNVHTNPNATVATVVLRTSLVEHQREAGVFVESSHATVQSSVVRMTLPGSQSRGRGVNVQPDPAITTRPTLLMQTSLVDRNQDVGVFVVGDATIEASVVRDTALNTQQRVGRGVNVQADATIGPSTLSLRESAIEQSHEIGVAVISSDATIESCLVDDTAASAVGLGHGVLVLAETGPASATIRGTRVQQNVLAGVAVFGAHCAIGGSALTCQKFDLNQESYGGSASLLEDLGGNGCGCPSPTETCKAVSAGLAVPEALPPVPE